jgi:hypothetical protein
MKFQVDAAFSFLHSQKLNPVFFTVTNCLYFIFWLLIREFSKFQNFTTLVYSYTFLSLFYYLYRNE